MAKVQKFLVGNWAGATAEVEARSLSGALKAAATCLGSAVASVSAVKPPPTSWCKVVCQSSNGIGYEEVKVSFPGGGEMIGSVEAVNAIFAAMGYGAIKIARNMMSGQEYIEAVGAPSYCSPSSEAYWSM